MNHDQQSQQMIFITGTDTDVGKTFISKLLIATLLENGQRVVYWKPVQTGDANSDPQSIDDLFASNPLLKIYPSSYSYPSPLSPDQAAAADRLAEVSLDKILRDFQELKNELGFIIVEGAGGLLVPLNQDNKTWIDFLQQSQLPCVLVSRAGLGTLNHTSLSLSTLNESGLDTKLCIINGELNIANQRSLERVFPKQQFTAVGRCMQIGKDEIIHYGRPILECINYNTATTVSLKERDRKAIWHPYTQHKTENDFIELKSARGAWLYTTDGKKLFDGISSWWVNSVGHGRKEIASAIKRQQQILDHVIFARATHEPAVALAENLLSLCDNKFTRVFYSDNGSTALEVALKMAYQYWQNKKQNKRHYFVSLNGSYHGDTFGAMSIASGSIFHDKFRHLLFKTLSIDPVLFGSSQSRIEASLSQIDTLIASRGDEICGLVVEPFIQGAGGMLMQDPRWLESVCELFRSKGIKIIFDEVFVGMGRLGSYFAYQQLNFRPDIFCLAKGLTGGNLPLSVTITHDDIFNAFMGDDKKDALLHGHSYTANPIACAAALATLEIYEQDELIKNAQRIGTQLQKWIDSNARQFQLVNLRTYGAVLAFEIPWTNTSGYFSNISESLSKKALNHGLFLRPLGNTVYLAPPLASNESEIAFALRALENTLAGQILK